jgi:hypothetical protein
MYASLNHGTESKITMDNKSFEYVSMANTYQRNKQDFSYRNGCAKEISKEIKVRKNKKMNI